MDATAIISANAGGKKEFTDKAGNQFTWGSDVFTGADGKTYKMDNFQWGEVDGNGTATLLDATAIISANAGGKKQFTTKGGATATWADAENPVEITYSDYTE